MKYDSLSQTKRIENRSKHYIVHKNQFDFVRDCKIPIVERCFTPPPPPAICLILNRNSWVRISPPFLFSRGDWKIAMDGPLFMLLSKG